MPHAYEICRRLPGQHRAGQFALMIDGIDAEYTNDPAQFMKKAMREAIECGAKPGPDALEAANEIAVEYSNIALQRVINHLRQGRMFPGGAPLMQGGTELFAPLKVAPNAKRRSNETQAVHAFLSRGSLSVEVDQPVAMAGAEVAVMRRPLTEDERRERIKRRDTQTDHEAEWRVRREAIIAARENERAKIESELKGSPDRRTRSTLEKRLRQLVEIELPSLKSGIRCASHGYQYAYGQLMLGTVDLVDDDIRFVKCMSNTTVDTERDAVDAVSDFSTLDENDGSGYTSGGQALNNQAVNIDDANDRAEFDADDVTATLGAGTRDCVGNLLIKYITNLNASLPLFWLEYAVPKSFDGSSFTDQINAEGILQAADG